MNCCFVPHSRPEHTTANMFHEVKGLKFPYITLIIMIFFFWPNPVPCITDAITSKMVIDPLNSQNKMVFQQISVNEITNEPQICMIIPLLQTFPLCLNSKRQVCYGMGAFKGIHMGGFKGPMEIVPHNISFVSIYLLVESILSLFPHMPFPWLSHRSHIQCSSKQTVKQRYSTCSLAMSRL